MFAVSTFPLLSLVLFTFLIRSFFFSNKLDINFFYYYFVFQKQMWLDFIQIIITSWFFKLPTTFVPHCIGVHLSQDHHFAIFLVQFWMLFFKQCIVFCILIGCNLLSINLCRICSVCLIYTGLIFPEKVWTLKVKQERTVRKCSYLTKKSV